LQDNDFFHSTGFKGRPKVQKRPAMAIKTILLPAAVVSMSQSVGYWLWPQSLLRVPNLRPLLSRTLSRIRTTITRVTSFRTRFALAVTCDARHGGSTRAERKGTLAYLAWIGSMVNRGQIHQTDSFVADQGITRAAGCQPTGPVTSRRIARQTEIQTR
jgi:hypothetical protein